MTTLPACERRWPRGIEVDTGYDLVHRDEPYAEAVPILVQAPERDVGART